MALQGDDTNVDWRAQATVAKGRDFLTSHPLWSCNFIPRSCNFVAHNLARWANFSGVTGVLDVDSLPSNLFCTSEESSFPPDPGLEING